MPPNEITHLDDRRLRDRLAVPVAEAAFSSSWQNAVLVCSGELDPGSNPELRRALDQVVVGATDRELRSLARSTRQSIVTVAAAVVDRTVVAADLSRFQVGVGSELNDSIVAAGSTAGPL